MERPRLTFREEEVVRCLARGLSNKEIASLTGITVGTAKSYIAKIYRKFPKYSRQTFVLVLAKEHAIQRLAELNDWVIRHGESLTEPALSEITAIVAKQVAEFLTMPD